MAHSRAVAPSPATRALGLAGILGGVLLVAAFLPGLPWGEKLFNLRLVLFNIGAIAIVAALYRRQPTASSRLPPAAATAAVLANAWFLVMVVLSIDRPQPPDPDPGFRLVGFYAGVAMWWADAAFGLVALRFGGIALWGALALTVGSVLAFLGMDRLELVTGPYEALFVPLALTGLALNGLGWILLGLDVALRRRPALAE